MRVLGAIGLLGMLAACAEPAPPAPRGVGFGDYDAYATARIESQQSVQPGLVVSSESSEGASPTGTNVAAASAVPPRIDAASAANPSISDEQDFDAVSNRQTIESDRERLERQREQFQVIEPAALPSRPGGGANVVAFALATSHEPGTQVYSRSGLTSSNRYARNCARYQSADKAQEAFLRAGGPERDSQGLDPDGDGYACGWDPRPFRRIGG
ncbi:MAG: hypothetical protein AAGF74_00215 [Pseudomonadota bacterium]